MRKVRFLQDVARLKKKTLTSESMVTEVTNSETRLAQQHANGERTAE